MKHIACVEILLRAISYVIMGELTNLQQELCRISLYVNNLDGHLKTCGGGKPWAPTASAEFAARVMGSTSASKAGPGALCVKCAVGVKGVFFKPDSAYAIDFSSSWPNHHREAEGFLCPRGVSYTKVRAAARMLHNILR